MPKVTVIFLLEESATHLLLRFNAEGRKKLACRLEFVISKLFNGEIQYSRRLKIISHATINKTKDLSSWIAVEKMRKFDRKNFTQAFRAEAFRISHPLQRITFKGLWPGRGPEAGEENHKKNQMYQRT